MKFSSAANPTATTLDIICIGISEISNSVVILTCDVREVCKRLLANVLNGRFKDVGVVNDNMEGMFHVLAILTPVFEECS
jgi:hypothetical protein